MAKMESKLITDFVSQIVKKYDHLSRANFIKLNTLEKTEAQLLNVFANLETIYEKFYVATGLDDGTFPDMTHKTEMLNGIIDCYKLFNNIATNLEVLLLKVDLEKAKLITRK